MSGSSLPAFAGAKPTESDLPRVAVLSAVLAAVSSAPAILAQEGVRGYLPILALIVLVTLAVFVWAVPSAMDLDEPGPTVVALTLSGLAVLTVLIFWAGVPAVLGAGGIVLGRTQLDVPEDRRLAQLAIRLGAAAIVLFLAVWAADLLLA